MKCKICGYKHKNNLSLSRHLRFNHNISLIDYKIKYENFKVPKCICKNDRKHKEGITLLSTCGDKKCVKETLRIKRLEFMKENPNKTAWRSKNISYSEKVFIELLKKYKLDKRFLIIREKSVFPYFIDFAFDKIKIAVEIDGSQHNLPERKEKDNKKDRLLISKGWRVFRVTAREVNEKGEEVINKLKLFIGNEKKFEKSGIILSKTIAEKRMEIKIKNQKERKNRNGLTLKEEKSHISQRKVERPTYKKLKGEINELGYSGTGRKYGVSDNAIRKWIKTYEKYNI